MAKNKPISKKREIQLHYCGGMIGIAYCLMCEGKELDDMVSRYAKYLCQNPDGGENIPVYEFEDKVNEIQRELRNFNKILKKMKAKLSKGKK